MRKRPVNVRKHGGGGGHPKSREITTAKKEEENTETTREGQGMAYKFCLPPKIKIAPHYRACIKFVEPDNLRRAATTQYNI